MIDIIEKTRSIFIYSGKKSNELMKKIRNLEPAQHVLVALGAFSLILVLSVLFFAIFRGDLNRRVIFFPDAITHKLVGEERFIKGKPSTLENVKSLVAEILLGPSGPDLLRIFPKETKLISILAKGQDVYINLSEDILFNTDRIPLKFDVMFLACNNTLRFNFSGLAGIHYFIHGEELNFGIASKTGTKTPLDEVGFIPDLLQ
jgi:hypothetical protein